MKYNSNVQLFRDWICVEIYFRSIPVNRSDEIVGSPLLNNCSCCSLVAKFIFERSGCGCVNDFFNLSSKFLLTVDFGFVWP